MTKDEKKIHIYNSSDSPIRLDTPRCELCGIESSSLLQRIPLIINEDATIYISLSLNESLICWYLCTVCADKMRRAIEGVIEEALDG